jgi:hypothetical protein
MANDPPFATLNHFAADLGIPSESDLLRIGISLASSEGIGHAWKLPLTDETFEARYGRW